MTTLAGTVIELWRYPVKSMGGETCAALTLGPRGVTGDRLWAVVDADGKLGSGKNTRRFRRIDGLLDCTARLDGDVPVVSFPDGHEVRADSDAGNEAMRSFLRRRDVSLSIETAVAHHDAAPLHLLTDASISSVRERVDDAAVDVRRFRPNIVIGTDLPEDFPEDAWTGLRIRIGEVVVEVTQPTERCVMTNAAQSELERSHQVLTEISSANDLDLGVYATIVRPGVVRRGDPLVVQ